MVVIFEAVRKCRILRGKPVLRSTVVPGSVCTGLSIHVREIRAKIETRTIGT
jgi:hypothetical protein